MLMVYNCSKCVGTQGIILLYNDYATSKHHHSSSDNIDGEVEGGEKPTFLLILAKSG